MASIGNNRAKAISENEPNYEPDCESNREVRHHMTERPIVRIGFWHAAGQGPKTVEPERNPPRARGFHLGSGVNLSPYADPVFFLPRSI